MASASPADHWSLDKRVPIALIGVLFLQAMTFIWWAAKLDSRVDQLETRLGKEERTNERQEGVDVDAGSRLVRLEERTVSILEILRRIDTRLGGSPPSQTGHP